MRKIALIIAMGAEARPLIDALNLVPDESFGDPKLPFLHFRGKFGEKTELLLTTPGHDPRYNVDNIGTQPATLAAYLTLSSFRPNVCLNLGTAGGFRKRGGCIGDVYVSDRPFVFHDRRIDIPGFVEYGQGHFPVA